MYLRFHPKYISLIFTVLYDCTSPYPGKSKNQNLMKKPKISTNLKFPDAEFEIMAQAILASMTANPYFPAPTPSTIILAAGTTAYTDALLAAQSRDKNSVANKIQRKAELLNLLQQLAASVTATANGDRAILVSSGFPLQKETGDATPLQKPENLQVINGINPGEQISSVDGQKVAKSYIHQYTPDPLLPDSVWVQTFTTASKYTFKDLVPAQKYWFKVTAIGTKEQIAISDTLSRIVQ